MGPSLIVALDVDSLKEAETLVDLLGENVSVYKVGSHLFTAYGPEVIRMLSAKGKKIFLDLKYHDIPNTVANAVAAATGLNQSLEKKDAGIFMLTVHTVGGKEMLQRAVEASKQTAQRLGVLRPMIVGITVLTSEAKTDSLRDVVLQRARLAKDSGLDGIVCSVEEAPLIRQELGKDFIIVTPGIRLAGSDQGDQKRIATPSSAIKNGSNFLVVGRPILEASHPQEIVENILEEIRNVG